MVYEIYIYIYIGCGPPLGCNCDHQDDMTPFYATGDPKLNLHLPPLLRGPRGHTQHSSPLKHGGWETTFLLGWPIFRGELLVMGRVFRCV